MGQGRRVVFPEAGSCAIERFDVPATLKPNEVLLRTVKTLVSPGTEMTIYAGRHTNLQQKNGWLRFPFRPGYAAVSEVIAVGADVTDIPTGSRVFAEAPHASHAVVAAERASAIPPGVSSEQAVFAELGAIALNGVRQGEVRLGAAVTVFGQGLVGLLALRLAHLAGAFPLIAIDLNERRLAIARDWGADSTHAPAAGETAAEATRDANRGELADVVIEATGSAAVIDACLQTARSHGRVVLLGAPHGPATVSFYDHAFSRSLQIVGAHVGRSAYASSDQAPWGRLRNRQVFLDLLARQSVALDEAITHRITPRELPELYTHLAQFPGDALGMVVDWESE